MNNANAESWVIRNNLPRQRLLGLGMAAGGLLLIEVVRRIGPVWGIAEWSGLALGVLLLLIGLGGLLSNQQTETTIDSRRRLIRIQDTQFWRTRVHVVMFKDIRGIEVQQVGDHSDGTPSYHLLIRRTRGPDVPLLMGVYDHSFDEAATQRLCAQVLAMVREGAR